MSVIGRFLKYMATKVGPALTRKLGTKLPKYLVTRPFALLYGLWTDTWYRWVALFAIIVKPATAAFQSAGLQGLGFWIWSTVGGAVVDVMRAVARVDTVGRGVQVSVVEGFPFVSVAWPYGALLWQVVTGLALVLWFKLTISLILRFKRPDISKEVQLLAFLLFFVPTVGTFLAFGEHGGVPWVSVEEAVVDVVRFVRRLPVVGDEVPAPG